MSLAARRASHARLAGEHLRQVVQRRRLRARPGHRADRLRPAPSGSRSEHKPKLIVAGASAYSRVIDWKRFRDIADSVGAYLMVDMAHYAGLIAAGLYPSPVGIADFVTSTTHKTLRGPRGGFILAGAEHEKVINSAIFPGLQGGPLMHVIAAKAVAFKEALTARVQGLPGAGARERARAGDRAAGARLAHRLRRHRFAHVPGRPAREEDHRQGRRGGAAARAHHRQQERDPERSREAVRHQRHPHRQPGDDDARLQRDRMRAARAPDRRRARCAEPTTATIARGRGVSEALARVPGVRAGRCRELRS